MTSRRWAVLRTCPKSRFSVREARYGAHLHHHACPTPKVLYFGSRIMAGAADGTEPHTCGPLFIPDNMESFDVCGKLTADGLFASSYIHWDQLGPEPCELTGRPPKTGRDQPVSHHVQMSSRDTCVAWLSLLGRAHFREPSVLWHCLCVLWCLLMGVLALMLPS